MRRDTRFLMPLLRHMLGAEAARLVRARMEKGEAKVIAGMRSKDMFPPHVTVAVASRDALFRLWKAVVGSGTIADLLRDAMDQDVVPLVVAQVPPPGTLEEIVAATKEAALAETFPAPEEEE